MLVCAIKYCPCNRFTNYPLKSLFSLKWIGSSKSQKGMSVTVAHENT